MKILFIAKNIPLPKHQENDIILKLADVLNLKNVDVDFLYPKELFPQYLSFLSKRLKANKNLKDEFLVGGHVIKTVSYIRLFFLPYFEWLLAMLPFKNNSVCKPDIIHTHFVFPDLLIAHGMKIKKAKIVVTVRQGDIHNLRFSSYNKKLFKKYLLKTDIIIAPSPQIKLEIQKYLGETNKVKIIPNFISESFYSTPYSGREDYNKTEMLKIICISNLIKRKNVDWLIKVHKKRSKYFELVIVGDGPELNYLKKIADKSVRFTGRLEQGEVIKELDKSDIFVLPSNNETFGLVYIEAMSRGKPVIGKRNTGLDGYENEALHFVEDESELLLVLDTYSSLPEEEKESLSIISKSFSEEFNQNFVVNKLISEYEKLL